MVTIEGRRQQALTRACKIEDMECVLFLYIVGSLVAIASHSMSQSNSFTISPESVNTTENSTASFYCRHRDGLFIDWLVNETSWRLLPTAIAVLVTARTYPDAQGRVAIFSITAQPIINNSVIKCVADDSIYSEPAFLLIQGQFHQVKNLTVEIAVDLSLIIQWRAPFSLINIEVTYCVDVYNSTDQILETSICGLNKTQYRYESTSDPSPCDGVDIYVIPVNSAGNGSRSHIMGTFYMYNGLVSIVASDIKIVYMSDDRLLIQITNISDWNICYCSVCIRKLLTEGLSTDACYNASHDDNQMSVFLNRIEWNQKYAMRIILHNAAGSTSSNGSLKFSTHDVQSITIHSTMVPGRVRVEVHFIKNSLARGCLLILSQAQYTGYFAIKKESGRELQSTHIENLPEGEYTVRGYDIESDGLPNHPTPAVILYNIALSRGSALQNQINTSTRLTIYADSAGNICINSSMIPITSYELMLSLLHPMNDLSNITVREVNISVQQPYCIHIGREDTYYSVIIFEWTSSGIDFHPIIKTTIKLNQSSTQILSSVLIYLAASCGSAVIICLLCLLIAFKSKMKRKDMQGGAVKMKDNVAYAVPKVTDSEVIYESIE